MGPNVGGQPSFLQGKREGASAFESDGDALTGDGIDATRMRLRPERGARRSRGAASAAVVPRPGSRKAARLPKPRSEARKPREHLLPRRSALVP